MNRVSAVPISPRAPRSHQAFGLGVVAFHLNAGEIGTAKESKTQGNKKYIKRLSL